MRNLENYIEVKDRLNAFQKDHRDNYSINITHKSNENAIRETCKITLYTDNGKRIFVDSATEYGSDRKIQEKCSSHALGRALSLAGYQGAKFGENSPIASKEEMESFYNSQEPKKASMRQVQFILNLCKQTNNPYKQSLEYIGLEEEDWDSYKETDEYDGQLTMEQAKGLINDLKSV